MKRIIVFILLLVNVFLLKAQNNIDIDDIFKMQLFLDRKNIMHSSTFNITKNDSLYKEFKESLTLEIDTLKNVNNLSVFIDPFKYYKIDLRFLYQKIPKSDSSVQSLSLPLGMTTILIIAVNQNNGLTYRLKGFNGNDFFNYFRDVKSIYFKQIGISLSKNKFINKYSVENLDFRCLFKNIEDSPCLIKYSEPIRIE